MKKKILIVQKTISHYNIPLYDLLARYYDLTLMFSDEKCLDNHYAFKTFYNPVFVKHFTFQKYNLFKMAKSFDAVICMFDFSYLYFRFLLNFRKRTKLLFWGIGVSASYQKRFDEDQTLVSKYLKWIRKSDAVIMYTKYAADKYINMGADSKKIFVAPNTVVVNKIVPNSNRRDFLFIGTLYKEKKVDILLEQYFAAYQEDKEIGILNIVGNGPYKEIAEEFVAKKGLQNKILFHGQILNEEVIADFFRNSLLCISPDQAGLSVLKSMGYGVAFVTHENAITGGERLNICNKENGILLHDFSELKDVILDASHNNEKYIEYGKNAYHYYWENRTIEKMAKGFVDAIDFSLKR